MWNNSLRVGKHDRFIKNKYTKRLFRLTARRITIKIRKKPLRAIIDREVKIMAFNEKDYDFKVSAAGRVNLIGEHVDYCGGKVFPAALSMKNTIYIRANGTDKINLSWSTLPDKFSVDMNEMSRYKSVKHANYFVGSALLWREAGHKLVGADIYSDCAVPFGSGLSSSAAIEVSTIAALATVAGEKFDPVEVALTAQKAEHDYAGVNCGIMDQYASACGKKGHAMLLNCATLECEQVPVELGDAALVIINCNKPHDLIESKYNERRAETEEALRILKGKLDISCLAEVSIGDFEKYGDMLPPVIYKRAKHVVEECDRVERASKCMRLGDMVGFGKILNESHESLSKLYEVTGRELDALASAAHMHPACLGSRMTGAGFGGCTISLVKKDQKEDFKRFVAERYEKEVGYKASCYDAVLSDGITVEKLR